MELCGSIVHSCMIHTSGVMSLQSMERRMPWLGRSYRNCARRVE
jgi:hypothetical protein